MSKKKIEKRENNALINLGLGFLALIIAYGFGSLAIESGSLWHYTFAFASFYFAVHYIKLSVKGWLKTNDKSKKVGRAKS